MLGKLIKYEIKSIYKYFLVLYAVIIAGAFTSYGTISASSGLLSKLGFSSFILCIFAMMALGVLLLIFTITRFNTSLLGDEGYLMFTVPTSTHNIIWSKAIAILIFDVLSVLIVCLVMGGYIYFVGDLNFANLDKEVVEVLKLVFSKPGTYLIIFLSIIDMFITFISSIMIIYAALSFGQMPTFKKHKNLSAIGFFVGFSIISEYVITRLGFDRIEHLLDSYGAEYSREVGNVDASNIMQIMSSKIDISLHYFSGVMLIMLLMSLVEVVILYAITYHILNKRLNLD